MNQIKRVETPDGEKFELHWEGKVKQYDTRGEADRAMIEKMAEDAGRPGKPPEGGGEGASQP